MLSSFAASRGRLWGRNKTTQFTFFLVSALCQKGSLLRELSQESLLTCLDWQSINHALMQCACCWAFTDVVLPTTPPIFGLLCYMKHIFDGVILCVFVLAQGWYCDIAQGCTGMIPLLFCCIDFSAIKHYTESSPGDNLRSVPEPSSLRCGWLSACHSTAPCGVISLLSLDWCLTSGQSVCALHHITVSSFTLMLSDGHRAGCCS